MTRSLCLDRRPCKCRRAVGLERSRQLKRAKLMTNTTATDRQTDGRTDGPLDGQAAASLTRPGDDNMQIRSR